MLKNGRPTQQTQQPPQSRSTPRERWTRWLGQTREVRLQRIRRVGRRLHLNPAAWISGLVAVGVVLFICYLHVSRTVAVDSDGASNALQAWAMLHGNPLLRGWHLSDVSFYTTELPEYMLIEVLRGLTPEVVHIGAALTYTLLVLLTALLAKGSARGRAGLLRALLAAGIMLAPQQSGASVLLLSPDHVGSTVPVLALWLILDRAPRRWYVPVAAWMLLAWALIADSIVLITGVVPLAAVAVARGYQMVVQRRQPARSALFELSLLIAAIAATETAYHVLALIAGRGGFIVWPISHQIAPFGQLPSNFMLTIQGILLLFGANFLGQPVGLAAALAALHLIGIVLAGWAVCVAVRRFAGQDIAVQLMAVGLLFSLAAYVFGTVPFNLNSTREFTAVLPLGAALAGRLLAGRLAKARLGPALSAVLVCYLVSLGLLVAQPPVPAQDQALAGWLSTHRLDYGLAGYWDANIVTVDTGGMVAVRDIKDVNGQLQPDTWEVQRGWYRPTSHVANFVVIGSPPPSGLLRTLRANFGRPVKIYNVDDHIVLVWRKNLLASLR